MRLYYKNDRLLQLVIANLFLYAVNIRGWLTIRSVHGFVTPNHGGNMNQSKKYSSKTSEDDTKDVVVLSKAIRIIYEQGGTLGVLRRSDGMHQYSAPTLVRAALKASNGNKGMASGILNAFLGACCLNINDDQKNYPSQRVIDLMKAYDSLGKAESSVLSSKPSSNSETMNLTPDLVALSLAYVATSQSSFEKESERFLYRAEKHHGMEVTTQIDNTPSSLLVGTITTENLLQKYNIQILQDETEFMVVSKPSGMVCYHASSFNNRKAHLKQQIKKKQPKDLSLEEILLEAGVPLSTLNGVDKGRGLVHRLDRGTSGCIVLAKTNRMHARLLTEFFLRRIKKSYQALVVMMGTGENKIQQKGTISLPIDGRPAISTYSLEKQFHNLGGDALFARIRVKTEQGRRHQVRLHCSRGLNAPILLDPLYGGTTTLSSSTEPLRSILKKQRRAEKFCLHADSLFVPEVGIGARAPLPDWWQEVERQLCVFPRK